MQYLIFAVSDAFFRWSGVCAIVVICWEARIVSGEAGPTAESLEVRPFATRDIPWPHIAFETTTAALRDLLCQRGDEALLPPQ